MPPIRFRRRCVIKCLLNLDPNKSVGPDNIPPIVLKHCAQSLAKPLCRLFNYFYINETFPTLWKTANVQSIPKKGNRSDPLNYRPIAILRQHSLKSWKILLIVNCCIILKQCLTT